MNSPEEVAEDFIRTRWRQIAADLRRLDVLVAPTDVFEDPKADGEGVQLRPKAKGRVGIVVASAVRNVLYGEVRLEIRETYSYAELRADPTKPLRMLDYRYQFSYFPELLVESAKLQTTARSYWGDLLLSHRRTYRFRWRGCRWLERQGPQVSKRALRPPLPSRSGGASPLAGLSTADGPGGGQLRHLLSPVRSLADLRDARPRCFGRDPTHPSPRGIVGAKRFMFTNEALWLGEPQVRRFGIAPSVSSR